MSHLTIWSIITDCEGYIDILKQDFHMKNNFWHQIVETIRVKNVLWQTLFLPSFFFFALFPLKKSNYLNAPSSRCVFSMINQKNLTWSENYKVTSVLKVIDTNITDDTVDVKVKNLNISLIAIFLDDLIFIRKLIYLMDSLKKFWPSSRLFFDDDSTQK